MRTRERLPGQILATTIVTATVMTMLAGGVSPASASGTWLWPVSGPVIRAFDPPDDPYGAGHRGIDIAAPFGTPFQAPAPGTVTFAGTVAGNLFLTIDHGGGLESTYSWISSLAVKKGDTVSAGQVVGATGTGHPGSGITHLHMGVKLDDVYVDPLEYLAPMSVSGFIRLAPLTP
jgi:murein DD-endopeptidase MepM/ murein hydrolase activator NlpD